MIEINLLPIELRVKKRKQQDIPWIKLGIAAGIIFGLVTTWFYIDFVNLNKQFQKLEERYEDIQPQYGL